MAKATTAVAQEISTVEQTQAALWAQIQDTLCQNADGVMAGAALLQVLEEAGWLDIGTAMVREGRGIVQRLVEHTTEPGAANGLKNVLSLMQGLSSLDPDGVAHWTAALAGASRAMSGAADLRPNGVWDLMRLMRHPDVSAGLGVVLAALKGIGESARAAPSNTAPSSRREARGGDGPS